MVSRHLIYTNNNGVVNNYLKNDNSDIVIRTKRFSLFLAVKSANCNNLYQEKQNNYNN